MTYSPTDVRDALVTTEAREVSPQALGVGLRTHPLRFDNHNASDALPRVAEEFLVASRNTRHDRETQLSVAHYFTDPVTIALAQATRSPLDGAKRIQLPESRLSDVSLAQVLAGRRSARDFASAPLPFGSLASVLRYGDSETIEVQSRLESGGEAALRLRTAPSAGGLFPVEVWVVARNITELERGIYRYLPDADALETWAGEQELTRLLSSCADVAGDDLAGTCGALLLFVASPWRSMRKYGPRGLRFVLHETGSIAQNIHLTATALGLGSLDYSGFFDDETHRALGIDGVYRAVVHMVLLGARR
ncbi:SagB/ThcOx family dehydrogenase [Streptomyces sp. RPT161]|uniref:SagB/ThcOx family dehydrogenase n=1 Tax=Streptomyces sp. RPT161 TaxID=3015993 RepID=UPI0022B92DAF|nr:SagB/ThcOx family dehydrogenase [Streptomyces sp. RPT161]